MSNSESRVAGIVRKRSQIRLSSKLEKKLWAYAAAASAAGIGILATAPGAEAKVVYTPTNQKVPLFSSLPIDMNGDGAIDFYLVQSRGVSVGASNVYSDLAVCHTQPRSGYGCISSASSNAPNAANEVRVVSEEAADLAAGAQIGPGQQWGGKGHWVNMALRVIVHFSSKTSQQWRFPWANQGKGVFNRYLGFKFKIGNDFHYGWARVSVRTSTDASQGFYATLTGYAYETVPGKAIVAGATSDAEEVGAVTSMQPMIDAKAPSLGMLGRGAAGLAIWRKEDSPDGMSVHEC
jgi:hypothetical protein